MSSARAVAVRSRLPEALAWLAFVALLVVPALAWPRGWMLGYLAQTAAMIVLALSYNLLLGTTGLLSFGHAAFAGLGAFVAAHSFNRYGLPLPLVPLAGGAAGAAFGALFGFVATRRAGTAFAMITLGIGELVAAAAWSVPEWFGGAGGVSIDRAAGPALAGWEFGKPMHAYALIAAWCVIAAVAMRVLVRTRLARLANAVRDNPARVAVERRRTASLPPHTRFVGRSGGELPVDGNAAPTFDANGKLVGAVLVVRDVSERERAEERFRLAVEAAPTAMIMVGRDGRIVLVNSQAEKLFGYARGDMIGHGIDMLVPERFRAGHWAHRDAFFGNPDARPMGEGRDLFGLRRDGSEFPVEIGLNPITTSEGAFVLCSIADITARKRAELELRRRSEELARSNQDLEQFAYVASHDLQEPLRAVAGPLQLLQRRYQGQLDARADEFIGHAVDGATRMQSLIDDLLSYSRVGRLEDARRPVDCEHVLDEALRNLSAAIRESGAQVTHDPLPTVHGIEAQLVLLFQNLIGNAIKFRGKDRVARIHLEAHTRDDAWLLRVRDNGIGIDPQYFERIFLIFQRLHTRREYPGTGLGLALCKRIVEHHGGRIFVESEPGQGTTFSFTLSRPGADETRWPRDPRE